MASVRRFWCNRIILLSNLHKVLGINHLSLFYFSLERMGTVHEHVVVVISPLERFACRIGVKLCTCTVTPRQIMVLDDFSCITFQ